MCAHVCLFWPVVKLLIGEIWWVCVALVEGAGGFVCVSRERNESRLFFFMNVERRNASHWWRVDEGVLYIFVQFFFFLLSFFLFVFVQ